MGKTDRTLLAEKIIADNPHISGKRTLARMLIIKYPDVFDNDIEKARNAIRQVTGYFGRKSRGRNKSAVHDVIEIRKEDLQPDEGWQIPFVIPNSVKKLGVISDLHGVYMEESAIKSALSILKEQGIKHLLLNGDILDNHHLSRFIKNKNVADLPTELAFMKKFISDLRKEFTLYIKVGNHDFFLERYMMNIARELQGIQELKFEYLLGLDGLNVIHSLQQIQYGDLDILHGHEKPGMFSPEYVAKSVIKWWQQYKAQYEIKVLVSHFHTTDNFIQRNLDGSFAYGYVTGCMCKLKMDYHPYPRRNHGMAICTNNNGKVTVDNFEI